MRKSRVIVFGLSVFALAFGVGRILNVDRTGLLVRAPYVFGSPSASEMPRGATEITFVFVGSPSCPYSLLPEIPELLQRASSLVRAQADNSGLHFASMGVAQSSSTVTGVAYLERVGEFDEVSAGRRWHNSALLRYVYGPFRGSAVTPQVIVLERRASDEVTPHLVNERVLMRRAGLPALQSWVAAGAKVPMGWADSASSADKPYPQDY